MASDMFNAYIYICNVHPFKYQNVCRRLTQEARSTLYFCVLMPEKIVEESLYISTIIKDDIDNEDSEDEGEEGGIVE